MDTNSVVEETVMREFCTNDIALKLLKANHFKLCHSIKESFSRGRTRDFEVVLHEITEA